MLVPVLILFIFAGCGATISTEMDIDKNFAGSRVITLDITTDDLSKVTGGIDALENVIKDEKPDVIDYKISDSSDGKSIVFTIKFDSLKDYRAKVEKLISAGVTKEEKENDDVLVPTVAYERNESYFKKGIKFKENFSSVSLLDWFKEGIREAEIISESESNWYEMGNNLLTIEGKEYSPSSTFEVVEQEETCLNNVEVKTVVLQDNTIERSITFYANEETISDLAAKGCVLKDYLGGLAPEGAEFTNNEEEYSYTIKFTCANAEEVVTKTNAILQSENNAFTFDSVPNAEKLGYADITLNEAIDASFYLNYDSYYNPVRSIFKVYNNAEVLSGTVGEANVSYSGEEDGIRYSPNATSTYNFKLSWLIEFKDIEFDITSSGKDKIKVELDCKLAEELSSEMKTAAIDRIKGILNEENYNAADDGITITFSGKTDEVIGKVNQFSGGESGQIAEFFNIEKYEFETPSLFTSGVAYSVEYDFENIFGKSEFKVTEKEGLLGSKYFKGDAYKNDDGDVRLPSSGSTDIYEINLSIVALIFAVLSLAFVVVGVILLLKSLKSFKEYLAYIKENKPVKAATNVAVPAYAEVPTPVAVETPAETQVVAPAVGAVAETQEEEDVL